MRIEKFQTRITITDVDGNSLTIRKTPTGFEFYSSIANSKVSNQIQALQAKIIASVTKSGQKDNYADRFGKVSKTLKESGKSTFRSLCNQFD